jgi:hypothetical protein
VFGGDGLHQVYDLMQSGTQRVDLPIRQDGDGNINVAELTEVFAFEFGKQHPSFRLQVLSSLNDSIIGRVRIDRQPRQI